MDRFVPDISEALILPGWGLPPELYWNALGDSGASVFDYGFFDADPAPMLLPTADDICPVLVGHSMGCLFALRLAIAHPERVRALVLLNPFACFTKRTGYECGVDPNLPESMRKNLHERPEQVLKSFVRTCAAPSRFPVIFPETLNIQALDDGLVFLEETDLRCELPLSCETSIYMLDSACDRIVTAGMSDLFAELSGALRKTVPNAGHLYFLENPGDSVEKFRELSVI